ncbi:MAG TPA: molybdopterin-dependent oxidoreductase [Gemmatimonadales bacterium]|nr:molybdopterin-dependent oxidoreductase [Gemmatimonadales bacterium]
MTDLDRRRFLLGAAAAGASALGAACGWDGGRALRPPLLAWSGVNDWVSARLFSSSRLAREYAPARRTADSEFPGYYVSDAVPLLRDPAAWRLRVGGLVRRPAALAIGQLVAMPRLSYTVKHHCVEGWTAIATWAGVPFRALAEMAEPLPSARYVSFRSFDNGYSNGWDLASAMHPQTILAYAYNDRPLMPDHGAPLRLYSPTKLGYKNTKYLVAVEFTDTRPGGYWEDQGYPWYGGL